MTARTLGTHNLEDANGTATFFADVVFFTEALPERIRLERERIIAEGNHREKAHAENVQIVRPAENRSLAISFPRDWLELEDPRDPVEYHRAHGGRAGVTPGRGSMVVRCRTVDTGKKVALLGHHRINAAFEPFERGEGLFRAGCWEKHAELDARLIRELERDRYLVLAGGDPNTPPTVLAFVDGRGRPILREVGSGKDRLACSESARLTGARHLSAQGSDHRRFRANLTLPKEYR